MAETGTRPEIEDVLASIRRLVSQDSPRVAETYPATSTSAEVDPLLLTPAQLVNEQPEDPAPAPHVWSGEEAELAGPAATDPVSEDAPEPAATNLSEARRKPQNFEPDFDDDETVAWPGEDDLPESGLGDELTRLEDTLAHLEAEVARNGVNYEAETGDPFAPSGTEPLIELPEAFSAEDLPAEVAEDVAIDEGVEPGATDAGVPADDALSDAVAFERTSPSNGDPMPEGADAEAFAGQRAGEPAHDWEDLVEETGSSEEATETPEPPPRLQADSLRRLHLSDAEARVSEPEIRPSSYEGLRAELEADAAGDEDELAALEAELAATRDLPGAALHPAALAMDEQQLRQLVSALLREELQGALGTKITRNLRKLVRREVQRALMSRDLE